MDDICVNNEFCCNLSEDTQNRLCKACLRLRLKPKQEVVFEKDADQLAIIHSGVLVSLFRTKEGDEKSLELLKTGDLIGVENLFDQSPGQGQNLLSLTKAMLCLFPLKVIETFYQQCPDFSRSIVKSLSRRFQKSLSSILHMHTFNSEERVRSVLDLLKSENINTTYITHQDLAMMANLNRVTVTKAIKAINQASP